jgi:hypothetical protein
LVEVSSDVVFDETNGSPREQVDHDDIDEDEVPTAAMRTMAIGDVRPQEQQEQDQPSSSTMVYHPTQDDGQVCWSEGRNATLRSKSPLLSRCSDRDKAGRDTLRLIGTRGRPATKASHSAASSSSEARVRSGPL